NLNGHPKAANVLTQYAPGMSPNEIAEAQRQASQFGFPRLLRKAQAGDRKAQAQLGIAYATGEWTAQNYLKAVEWLTKAATQGERDAQYALGDMYSNGRGVNADYAQAFKWMRMAAEQGEVRAQASLGSMYDLGTGVPRNETEAFKWSLKAAQQGSAEGQYNVGFAYANGKGVANDDPRALEWYEKSAAQGYFNAMNNAALVMATSKDPGVRNPVRAIQYAQQVVDATGGNYPVYFDTLARCYFENRQLPQAISAEKRAVELAPGRDEYRVTLDRYIAIQNLQARQSR
ncbi:MAG: sel1 repeat family protein, partial [Acidobacteriaceae bacterium]|nr:sel1 repeat family protein [Acidobacteriaceae bacterium]